MTEVQGQMSDLIALIAHPEAVLTHSNAQHRRLVTLLRRGDAAACRAAGARAHRGHRAHPRGADLSAASELGGALHERAPGGVLALAPGGVAPGLDPLPGGDPLADLERSTPRSRRRRPPGRRLPRRSRRPRPAAPRRRRRRPAAESSSSLRVRPPSTRSTSTGTLSRTATSTSATRQAIASSAARATWPGRVAEVAPAITARASGRHHGAPIPASAGQHPHAARVLDLAARPRRAPPGRRRGRGRG